VVTVNPVHSLEDVAAAILDGTAVDWDGVESGTAESDRPLIKELRTLAALRLVAGPPQGGHCEELSSWGHLRVFERIGHGAFGEVFRAWDTRLDREVALKLLPAGSGADTPESSVIEEGRLLARVRHPNVVTIYGAERIDGRIGLWMEFIKGRTLEESVKAGSTFTAKAVTRIGIELCAAVSAVHAAGLLHRDIKAQNVMMTDEGRLVLMDFGTGREVDDASAAPAAGTPLYLAPEVLAGGAPTSRSDGYSVGVVLYRLLTGSFPVQGRSLAELRSAHANREQSVRLTPVSTAAAIPGRLGRVVARALHPNPERRYASASELGQALLNVDTLPRRVFFSAAAAAVIASLVGLAWQYQAGTSAEASDSSAATAAIASPRIAVMPFRNLSSEPDSDFFVDGLTSEVIRNLGALGLPVRSQTSSLAFKNTQRDLQTIGKQLDVNLVLEADVQRVGNRLRINAQLVQVAGDVPLWSDQLVGTIEDVFAFQDQIARALVNRLRLTLGKEQRRYQTNIATYQQYLRARSVLAQRGNANARQAAALFERVIASDSAFAPAHAGLAEAYAELSWRPSGLSLEEGIDRMRPAALRALELDTNLAEVHAAIGLIHALERNWESAVKSFEHAIALNPALAQTLANYSTSTLIPLGQYEKARQLAATALTMDPLSLVLRWHLALAQFAGGHYEDAVDGFQRVTDGDPESSTQMLARSLTFAGRPADAIAVWESRDGQEGDWERWIARAYALTGRRADVQRLFDAHQNDERAYRHALLFAGIHDKDRTFEELNKAVEQEPHRVAFTLACPEMEFLRGDPRLDALRRRLNLR
jgi:serine/threonine-protein kinase